MGFVGAKVPCPYGPSAGDEGFRKNVAFFKQWRETVGDDYPLMLDCYMALTVPYAIQVFYIFFIFIYVGVYQCWIIYNHSWLVRWCRTS